MKMRRCDGCGATEVHTQDWSEIVIAICSETLDVCSPRCGQVVMGRLRPELDDDNEFLGRRKWNLADMRLGRS